MGDAVVDDRPALLLVVPAFPAGGAQGGHLIVLWDEGRAGYIVSVHFAGTDRPVQPRFRHVALEIANEVAVAR